MVTVMRKWDITEIYNGKDNGYLRGFFFFLKNEIQRCLLGKRCGNNIEVFTGENLI